MLFFFTFFKKVYALGIFYLVWQIIDDEEVWSNSCFCLFSTMIPGSQTSARSCTSTGQCWQGTPGSNVSSHSLQWCLFQDWKIWRISWWEPRSQLLLPPPEDHVQGSTAVWEAAPSVRCAPPVPTTSPATPLLWQERHGQLHRQSLALQRTASTDYAAPNNLASVVVRSITLVKQNSGPVIGWRLTVPPPPTQARGRPRRWSDATFGSQVTAGAAVRPWSLKNADRPVNLSEEEERKCG